jgi:Anti-sigma factor NepR
MPEAQDQGKKRPIGNVEVRIARAMRERVGEHLRQMYNESIKEPVSARIADLLRRLD